MAEVNYQVSADSDDAREAGGVVSLDAGGGFQLDKTDEWFGFRWTGVTIPTAATITNATVDVCVNNSSQDEPDVTIDFEDNGNPGTFTTGANDISGRTGTTNTVAWDVADLGLTSSSEWASSLVTLPDLSSIIQELVDSYDYSSGAPMVCRFQGADNTGARDLGIVEYSDSSSYGAKLHIEYTPGGGGNAMRHYRNLRI